MESEDRLLHRDWDLYDTRHVVFKPARLLPRELEDGYWRAYRDFYRWGSIFRGAAAKDDWRGRIRHVAYAGGWKKFEPLWDLLIRSKHVLHALPVLEAILSASGEAAHEHEHRGDPRLAGDFAVSRSPAQEAPHG